MKSSSKQIDDVERGRPALPRAIVDERNADHQPRRRAPDRGSASGTRPRIPGECNPAERMQTNADQRDGNAAHRQQPVEVASVALCAATKCEHRHSAIDDMARFSGDARLEGVIAGDGFALSCGGGVCAPAAFRHQRVLPMQRRAALSPARRSGCRARRARRAVAVGAVDREDRNVGEHAPACGLAVRNSLRCWSRSTST